MLATAEADVREETGTQFDSELRDVPQEVTRIEYPVAMSVIADLQQKYAGLTIEGINDKAGFTAVDEARREVKRLKVQVENRRKELKADALEYGRKVDSAAKRLSEPLEALEKSLDSKQKAITDEVERLKREAEEKLKAEKAAKLKARMSDLKSVECYLTPEEVEAVSDEDFATYLASKRQELDVRRENERTEQLRRNEEAERQRQENERLTEERRKLDEEKAELEKAKQEQSDREAEAQRKIDEENERLLVVRTKARTETLAAIGVTNLPVGGYAHLSDDQFETALSAKKVELEELKERERREADEKAQQEEAARVRAASLRPDREKLLAFANQLEDFRVPDVAPELKLVRALCVGAVGDAAAAIRDIVEKRVK